MPGVQYPHWRPWWRWKASCSGCRVPSAPARASIVVTSRPSTWAARSVQDFTDSPSRCTVHAPQDDVSHPTFVPVRPSCSRRKYTRSVRGSTSASRRIPFTVTAICVTDPPPSGWSALRGNADPNTEVENARVAAEGTRGGTTRVLPRRARGGERGSPRAGTGPVVSNDPLGVERDPVARPGGAHHRGGPATAAQRNADDRGRRRGSVDEQERRVGAGELGGVRRPEVAAAERASREREGALGRIPRLTVEQLGDATGDGPGRHRTGGGRVGDRRQPVRVRLFLGSRPRLEHRVPGIRGALLGDDEGRERRDQHEQDHAGRRELHGEGVRAAPRHDRRDEGEGIAHVGQLVADAVNAADPVQVVPAPYRTEEAAIWG